MNESQGLVSCEAPPLAESFSTMPPQRPSLVAAQDVVNKPMPTTNARQTSILMSGAFMFVPTSGLLVRGLLQRCCLEFLFHAFGGDFAAFLC